MSTAVTRSPGQRKTGRLSGPPASGIADGNRNGLCRFASRRSTHHEPRLHHPHQVPFLLRTLEHQHRRRPVRAAGPQGDGVRPQAQGVQGAGLRRCPVSRRRHRPGRPRLAEHSQGGRRGQEGPRRRGAVRRDHRTPAVGGPADDRRRVYLEQPGRPQVRAGSLQTVRRHRPGSRLQELRAMAGARGLVHPRGQGREDRHRADRRRLERDPRARQGDPHPRRGQAERADGPGVPADRRPHGGHHLQDDRPQPVGRADRERATRSSPASTRPTIWPMPCITTSSGACT